MNLLKTLYSRNKKLVFLVGLAFLVIFIFWFIYRNIMRKPSVDDNADIPKQAQIEYGLPVHLKISAIDVDSNVEHLGLTPTGAMDVPKGPDDVAWFNLGTRPGENGSAVIAGHYGTWKNGKGSVFDNLNKLRAGDKIYIEDDKGIDITFVVRESRSFDPKADASEVFSSDDEKSHLNLITCEGTWNKDSKSYSQRLVVFTDKE
jgi:LPXTG-site transpeptidase (sortase) family protein